jgi:trk system potassium uptake protein TrkH
MGFAVAIKILGVLLALFSTTMLPPALIAFIVDDGEFWAFIGAFAFTLSLGGILWLPLRHVRRELRTRDGFFIVTLFWSDGRRR